MKKDTVEKIEKVTQSKIMMIMIKIMKLEKD